MAIGILRLESDRPVAAFERFIQASKRPQRASPVVPGRGKFRVDPDRPIVALKRFAIFLKAVQRSRAPEVGCCGSGMTPDFCVALFQHVFEPLLRRRFAGVRHDASVPPNRRRHNCRRKSFGWRLSAAPCFNRQIQGIFAKCPDKAPPNSQSRLSVNHLRRNLIRPRTGAEQEKIQE
jgi:hypothetical protein